MITKNKNSKKDNFNEIILSQNISISTNTKETNKNKNTLVIGAPDSGKVLYHTLPNLMQCNSSYIVIDHCGILRAKTEKMFRSKGYEIKVFNLDNIPESETYNPFAHFGNINNESAECNILETAHVIATNLRFVKDNQKRVSDKPYVVKCASKLLTAAICYIYENHLKDKQDSIDITELISDSSILNIDKIISALDAGFNESDQEKESFKIYSGFKQYPSEYVSDTLNYVKTGLLAFKSEKFNKLMSSNSINFNEFNSKPTILYIIPSLIPDPVDKVIIPTLLTQLFASLKYAAETNRKNSHAPADFHIFLNNFCDIGIIPDFDQTISMMRLHSVSYSVVIDSIEELKTIYSNEWNSVVGCCDLRIYYSTCDTEFNKELFDVFKINSSKSFSKKDIKGVVSQCPASIKTELQNINSEKDIQNLSCDKCLVFINGYSPFIDDMYDYSKHYNYNLL